MPHTLNKYIYIYIYRYVDIYIRIEQYNVHFAAYMKDRPVMASIGCAMRRSLNI
jgi:hypothetical protein